MQNLQNLGFHIRVKQWALSLLKNIKQIRREVIYRGYIPLSLIPEQGGITRQQNYSETKAIDNKINRQQNYVEDLDSIITTVTKKNWWFRLSKPSASSKYIFVKDPDGYDIEILQK